MTDGLALLGGWIQLGALLLILAWVVLRGSGRDPMRNGRQDSSEGGDS